MRKVSQSFIDRLIGLMPSLLPLVTHTKPGIDEKAAMNLFHIWKNDQNKVGENVYKRPTSFSAEDVNIMKREGLVRTVGDKIEITSKGSGIINVMILGDDSSSFDDDGSIVGYMDALAKSNSPTVRTAKSMSKSASDNWWGRFEKK